MEPFIFLDNHGNRWVLVFQHTTHDGLIRGAIFETHLRVPEWLPNGYRNPDNGLRTLKTTYEPPAPLDRVLADHGLRQAQP